MRRFVFIVLPILLLFIVIYLTACWILFPEKVSGHVVKLENSYRVWIITEGRSWIPFSPEGSFPKWNKGSVFLLKEEGGKDGNSPRYIIGKKNWSSNYQSGQIIVDEAQETIRFDPLLNNEYQVIKCDFDFPKLELAENSNDVKKMNGKYVKVIGTLKDRWHCQLKDGVLLLSNYYEVGPKYEFIGWIGEGFGGDPFCLTVYDHSVIE